MDQTRFQKAIALHNCGQCEDAILEFGALEPEFNDANEKAALLVNQHRCYCELGRLKEAERVSKQIRALAPTNLEVRLAADFGEACMHAQMGEPERTLLEFDHILATYHDALQCSRRDLYETIQVRRGVALSNLGSYVESQIVLNEALTFTDLSADDRQEIHFYRAICHDHLGESTLAEKDYLETIAIGIENNISLHARYHVAHIYFKRRAFAQAKLHLEAIVRTTDRDVPNLPISYVYKQLSFVCKSLGDERDSTKYSELANARR